MPRSNYGTITTLFASGAAVLASLLMSKATGAPMEKPNVIFILVDDMGWSDLGCYGGEIKTPNIDSLADKGIRFTQAYNTAKCFPSRACLLTGVYAQQCNMDRKHGIIENAVTLGEVLRPAGYRTLASGKHHGTENLYDRGFDHYYGLRDGCCNYWNPGKQREGEPKPARKRTRHWCDDEKHYFPFTPPERDFYTTDVFTDKALEWLEEPETKEKPFMLYLAYNAPHYPLQAWPEDIAKYKNVYGKGYRAIQNARHKRQIEMGLIDPETAALPTRDRPTTDEISEEQIVKMQIYAAMIDRVDQNVGRLLDKLRRQGRLDNTLIFFAADNGACAEGARGKYKSDKIEDFGKINSYLTRGKNWAMVQDTPFRKYKNYSEEGGICTPLIAYWPDRITNPGKFYREPVHFIDIMSTLVDLTGADYPETHRGKPVTGMQGISLAPAFEGRPLKRENPLFWKWSKGGAVRKDNIKAVFWGKEWELYDLAVDRNEKHDLAGEKPELLQAMIAEWEQWYKEVNK